MRSALESLQLAPQLTTALYIAWYVATYLLLYIAWELISPPED